MSDKPASRYILRNLSLANGKAVITGDDTPTTVHFDSEGLSEPVSLSVYNEAMSVPGYSSGGEASFPGETKVAPASPAGEVAKGDPQKEPPSGSAESTSPVKTETPPAAKGKGKGTAAQTTLEKAQAKAVAEAEKAAQAEKEAAAAAEAAKDDGQRPPAPAITETPPDGSNLNDVLSDVLKEAAQVSGATV